MFLLNIFFTLGLVFCTLTTPAAWAQTRVDVTVYAAASLKESLDALIPQYQTQHGDGVRVRASYGASSVLARQIEKGAPADVFISADLEWMDYLEQRRSIRAGSRINLLSNRLVLIAPADSNATLKIAPNFPLAAALSDGRLAIADPASVPAGKYGKAALEALGVWPAVASKLAPVENVRAALVLVARGEAPFGVVYRTDAIAERKVRVIGEFAANLHPPIIYPAALLADGRSKFSESLLRFLRAPEARVTWCRFGFLVEG